MSPLQLPFPTVMGDETQQKRDCYAQLPGSGVCRQSLPMRVNLHKSLLSLIDCHQHKQELGYRCESDCNGNWEIEHATAFIARKEEPAPSSTVLRLPDH